MDMLIDMLIEAKDLADTPAKNTTTTTTTTTTTQKIISNEVRMCASELCHVSKSTMVVVEVHPR